MRAAVKILTVALVLMASLSYQPASAFWNLFEDWPGLPPQKQKNSSPLEDLRNTDCGDPLARNKFGETEFMRGRRTRYELSKELQKAMAAAFIAETPQDAKAILIPYLSTEDEKGRAATRIGLAFALLRKAAGNPQIWSEIRHLISHPGVVDRVDAAYINGALALYQRNWTEVSANATKVLEREPQHYNANVLRGLAVLQSVARAPRATRPSQCRATLASMIDALRPVMELGACPTQMAHLDVTAERYLTFRNPDAAAKQRLLRRLILAYVSRNNSAAIATLSKYLASNRDGIPCAAAARALKLIPALP